MEEDINLVTSVEANKYIWQQVKQLLVLRNFIACPGKPKCMVRLREHYLQMVYQEIAYGATSLAIIVIPAWTYQNGWFFVNRISLRRTNTTLDSGLNLYSEAAYRQSTSSKTYYNMPELVKMWGEVILPQLQKELVEYFDKMDFCAYVSICENKGDGILRYGSSCDGVRLLAIGYNCLWTQQYEKGEVYIRKAIKEMQGLKARRESSNSATDLETTEYLMFNLDLTNGEEVLNILEHRGADMEWIIRNKLFMLEKKAMDKNIHIALNEKKETVKSRP